MVLIKPSRERHFPHFQKELRKEDSDTVSELSNFPVLYNRVQDRVKERFKKYGVSDSISTELRNHSVRNLRAVDMSSGDAGRSEEHAYLRIS